jgi:DNA (cytosine-5)-methyltransferase 1
LLPARTAAECIDWSIPCRSIFGRKKPLAEATLRRIAAGVVCFVLRDPSPYLVGDMAPVLIQTGYGEREGQRPRYLNLHEPLGTVVAAGQKHALCAAFLARHYGGMVGADLRDPLPTVTARDHHSLVDARLEPAPAKGARRVRAFLTSYYGSGVGQSLRDPLRTITTKDRLGLVTVEGVDFAIVDIGLRMLRPHELLRAQFGRFAQGYDLSPAETLSDQVRLIGNSVAPEVAEALVRANLPRRSSGRRAA